MQAPRAAGHSDLNYAHAAWLLATSAMLGSLFFGEAMKLPPCTLCWYQRICLFPLVPILTAGIVRRDTNLTFYALPLTLIGLAIGVYHNLLYYGVIPETLSPCTQGVSCASRQLELFGFVTIPLLALGAFVAILTCLLLHQRQLRRPAP